MTDQIPSQNHDREGWLRWRHTVIGGSDAPVVLNKSPFKTKRELYWEKRNQRSIDPHNMEELEYFLMLEAIAAERYCKVTGREVRRQPPRLHPKHSELACTIDRQIINNERGPGVLEIKTAGPMYFRKLRLEGPPESYLIQTIHNMAVWGYSWGSLGIMNRDTGAMLPLDFDFDTEMWADIERQLLQFHADVQAGHEPVDLDSSSARPVKMPEVDGHLGLKDLGSDEAFKAALRQYSDAAVLEKQAKELKEQVRDLELPPLMQEHDAQVAEALGYRVYYTEVDGRPSFDKKLLQLKHPDIDLEEFTTRKPPERKIRIYNVNGG